MPEQNKKLAGFEALYQVDQDKRRRGGAAAAEPVSAGEEEAQPEGDNSVRNKAGKSVSKLVSNITRQPQASADVFEPTTFKADRRKVKALKRLALDLEPPRKLQDLFDEALTDILAKYGRDAE
ncbi:MAG: hypothetical protein M3416_04335 [Acidobacteriota bacterium]|nr:hypothetical protein [Acidobacteriota bacterium]